VTSSSPRSVAIVTGASQGIGAALVEGFRRSGYAVVGASRSIPAANEPDYVTVKGDIADPETAQRVVGTALERFGRVDSLVNNAGRYIGRAFTDYTSDDLADLVAVNLTGFFHMTQRAIEQMVSQGKGHIVSVSTSLAAHPDRRTPSAIAALTKGGLEAATRSLAVEYAGRGVRVNAVALGVIQTNAHDPASYEGLADRHPLGRVGDIADVVDGILYLERAEFVTGVTLPIDGGRSAGC
jgi:NAD(P)-dependent dehydrogenase (short-subunit alcohol dehydrogenase family)